MSRPKKDSNAIKSVQISLRMTRKDYLQVSEYSETLGLKIQDYIRKKITGRPLPKKKVSPTNRKLFVELSRVGNNLNQLTRMVNLGMRDSFSIQNQLIEVKRILELLKSKIVQNDR